MKKYMIALAALVLGLASCVKDEVYVAPEKEPEAPVYDAKVVINEIDCGSKLIELYNTENKEADISGYILKKDSDTWTIPAGKGKIGAKGYLVFTAKNSDAQAGPAFGISGTKGFVLSLLDPDEKEIDIIDNTGGKWQVPDGSTLARKVDADSEWEVVTPGTIGSSNGAAVEPEILLYINEVSCGEKKFEIYNGSSVAVDIAGYTFTKDDGDDWTVPEGKGNIPAKGFLVFTAKNPDINEGPSFGLSGTKGFKLTMYKTAEKEEKVDEIDNSASVETFKTVADTETLGRKTDGADEWVLFESGTIGASNNTGTLKQ